MTEIWLPVRGFPAYEVSNIGRVMRVVGGPGARAGVSIKPAIGRRGYLRTTLWRDGRSCRFLLHRLVAAHFIEESDLQINHRDGNKANNCVHNLEYVTARENILHAVRTGLRDTSGPNNKRAKLDASKVLEIRSSSESGYALAKKFGVTKRSIYLVRNGLTWGGVP